MFQNPANTKVTLPPATTVDPFKYKDGQIADARIDDDSIEGRFNKWKIKQNEGVFKHEKIPDDWIGDEAKKHLEVIRGRYPLLNQMLLKGTPDSNANGRSFETTNHYARAADAFNAGYRYQAPAESALISKDGFGASKAGQWTPVNKLETQDMKQMEQLRQAQADMRKYMLDEESFLQRDYWKRKLDEMNLLMNQDYKEEFFNADETMSNMKDMFAMWKKMSEEEFTKFMDAFHVPNAVSHQMRTLILQGRFYDAAVFGQKNGITPQTAEQVMHMLGAEPILKGIMTHELSIDQANALIGQLKGSELEGLIGGLLARAKASDVPEIRGLTKSLETLLAEVNKIVATYGPHVSDALPWVAGGAGALTLAGIVAQFLKR